MVPKNRFLGNFPPKILRLALDFRFDLKFEILILFKHGELVVRNYEG